jgi:hypothetical protein
MLTRTVLQAVRAEIPRAQRIKPSGSASEVARSCSGGPVILYPDRMVRKPRLDSCTFVSLTPERRRALQDVRAKVNSLTIGVQHARQADRTGAGNIRRMIAVDIERDCFSDGSLVVLRRLIECASTNSRKQRQIRAIGVYSREQNIKMTIMVEVSGNDVGNIQWIIRRRVGVSERIGSGGERPLAAADVDTQRDLRVPHWSRSGRCAPSPGRTTHCSGY